MGLPGRPGSGEPDFESWYRQEGTRLVNVLTLALADPGLAKDAADEAFARAYERWPRVRSMESPTGWTYKVALNYGRRRLMRRRVEHAILLRQARDRSAAKEPDSGRDGISGQPSPVFPSVREQPSSFATSETSLSARWRN